MTHHELTASLDRKIAAVLASPELDELDRELLRLLARFQGREHAAPLGWIARELKLPFATPQDQKRTARALKARVSSLIGRHGLPIGSSRGGKVPPGYYLIVTAEDHAHAVHSIKAQIKAEAERVRALSGPQFLAELFDQVRFELDREALNHMVQGEAQNGGRAA